ncbi:TlpA disulfide reductase family protein [soil metagenome]
MKRLLVAAVLAAVIGVFAHALTREPTLASPLVGRAAPGFEIPLFGADSSLTLSDLAGRPVVLNFWASWCLSCRDEAVVLEAGWLRYGPEVLFVGIAVNDESGPARAFIERYGKTYFLGADPDGSVAIDYGLFGVPETFFIAPDGRILAKHIGPLTAEELDRQVAALRAGKVGAASGDPEALTPLQPESR